MSLFFYKKENNWVCVFCVLMAIVFCGLMIVSVVALFIPKFNIETKSILDFNTLLSVLSLTFVISIASPYFISKNQIRDEVRKYLENEYKNYVEKEVEHITRTDAHLSRMIAFFLMDKKFYYWAIGWAFRALKRYKNIAGEYNNVYKEFHEFLFRDVILKSLDELKSNSKDCSAAIYYKIKNDELELVYVYAWDDKGDKGENAEWPGLMMKKTGNGLYFSDVKFSNIIFNDGGENQTVDLESQDGYFLPTSKNNKITGIWYKKNPNLAGGNGADDSSGNKDSETFVLSAPTGLKASYISSNSEIKVTWNSVSGADCYEFYWGTSNNPNKAKKGNDKTGTEAYLINVEEGDSFYFWVKAKKSDVTSDFSKSVYCSVPTSTINPPTGVTATSTSESTITVSWNAVSGATKYDVYYSTSPYSSSALHVGDTESLSMGIKNASANTTYYFWVKATDGNKTSGFSSWASVTIESSWPPAVYEDIASSGVPITKNLKAGETYWFRIFAYQPVNVSYKYNIIFFDKQAGLGYTSDVIGTYYNQKGTEFKSNIDDGSGGYYASYLLSQYLYIKIECKTSGSFRIGYVSSKA